MAQVNTAKLKASNRRAGRKIGGTVAIFIFLSILGIFMALPIYLTVVMSVKPVEELFVFPPKLYTLRPTTENYSDMFESLRQNRPQHRTMTTSSRMRLKTAGDGGSTKKLSTISEMAKKTVVFHNKTILRSHPYKIPAWIQWQS